MAKKMFFNKKMKIAATITAILTLGTIGVGLADGVAPGSEQDPVVTQSYVEQKFEQMKYYIDGLIGDINNALAKHSTDIDAMKAQLTQKDQQITDLKTQIEALKQNTGTNIGSGAKFEVVSVTVGKTVLSGEGSEIILRSGKLVAVPGQNGGLLDATVGKDLAKGEAIVKNHLLISSRSDGRGLKATANSYLIIKGAYTIK